jgi:hypothetical protein
MLATVTCIAFVVLAGIHWECLRFVHECFMNVSPPWLIGIWFGGLIIYGVGSHYGVDHAWVECKDQERVTRVHVAKLRAAVDDVLRTPLGMRGGWRPTHIILVARSHFDRDALELASSYAYECYRRNANGFERVYPPQ